MKGDTRVKPLRRSRLLRLLLGRRPEPRDIGMEPPYPGLLTVMFSLGDPEGLTAHPESQRCKKTWQPHLISECGEWQPVERERFRFTVAKGRRA